LIFNLKYLPKVKEDLKEIDPKSRQRIKKAIKERLEKAPKSYGKPLRKGLKGFYRLRVGDYRIVYCVLEDRKEVLIVGIMHRKEIYKRILNRILKNH